MTYRNTKTGETVTPVDPVRFFDNRDPRDWVAIDG